MDYQMMQKEYNLIRQRRMPQIERVVEQYGETYFRELIWTLEDRARTMMMDPNVLRRLFNW